MLTQERAVSSEIRSDPGFKMLPNSAGTPLLKKTSTKSSAGSSNLILNEMSPIRPRVANSVPDLLSHRPPLNSSERKHSVTSIGVPLKGIDSKNKDKSASARILHANIENSNGIFIHFYSLYYLVRSKKMSCQKPGAFH